MHIHMRMQSHRHRYIKLIETKISESLNTLLDDLGIGVEQHALAPTIQKLINLTLNLNEFDDDSSYFDFHHKTKTAAQLLSIPHAKYVKAALKQPQLFSQSPETINRNIEQAAALLGVDKQTYIEKAALKKPQLFYQSPETILRNASYIRATHEKGYIDSDDIIADMLKNPASFTIAPANTHLRAIFAHITQKTFGLGAFFTKLDKKTVEKKILEHFEKQQSAKTLRALSTKRFYPNAAGKSFRRAAYHRARRQGPIDENMRIVDFMNEREKRRPSSRGQRQASIISKTPKWATLDAA